MLTVSLNGSKGPYIVGLEELHSRNKKHHILFLIVGNSIAVNTSYKIPGGGLISDVEDMSLFIIALQLRKLVKPETWELMTTEVTTTKGDSTNYGFGWELGLPAIEGLATATFGNMARRCATRHEYSCCYASAQRHRRCCAV
jgi:hypothetical protein